MKTNYHDETPEGVINALEHARHSGERIRVFYGDTETGREWLEEWGTMGYVGRSCGRHSIPLLVHNARSFGGGGLLTNCIVKIMTTRTKRVLYQVPNYQAPNLTISKPPKVIGKVNLYEEDYVAGVYRDGDNVANFKSMEKAERWVAFMLGKRMGK